MARIEKGEINGRPVRFVEPELSPAEDFDAWANQAISEEASAAAAYDRLHGLPDLGQTKYEENACRALAHQIFLGALRVLYGDKKKRGNNE